VAAARLDSATGSSQEWSFWPLWGGSSSFGTLESLFITLFNVISTSFQRHFNVISTRFRRHFNALLTLFRRHVNTI